MHECFLTWASGVVVLILETSVVDVCHGETNLSGLGRISLKYVCDGESKVLFDHGSSGDLNGMDSAAVDANQTSLAGLCSLLGYAWFPNNAWHAMALFKGLALQLTGVIHPQFWLKDQGILTTGTSANLCFFHPQENFLKLNMHHFGDVGMVRIPS